MSGNRVYLVDDDPSCLEATARMLRASGYDVMEYDSAASFLTELEPAWNGCVVADLKMPLMDGLGLQRELKARNSPLPVVFLTARGSIPTSVEAMRQGAEDFLTKDTPSEDLIAAIERAFLRCSETRERYAELAALRERYRALTPREREVLQYVVEGKMNKQIAAELGIHERTVKLHRSSGTRKMGVSSVAELSILWHRMQEKIPES